MIKVFFPSLSFMGLELKEYVWISGFLTLKDTLLKKKLLFFWELQGLGKKKPESYNFLRDMSTMEHIQFQNLSWHLWMKLKTP